MYVLARRVGESLLMLDGLIEVKVLSVTGKIVRLGFNAPREVDIVRPELAQTVIEIEMPQGAPDES